MSSIVATLAADKLRATAVTARVALVVQSVPTPPAATRRQMEAGQAVVKQARAEAEAAHQKVQDDQASVGRRGVVV